MKYRLIDVENRTEENVQFGTCDLCQYVGTHYYDVLLFEDENGNVYREENGFWSWGDYITNWYIDNYIDFAHFITGKEFSEPEKDRHGDLDFRNVVNEMYNKYEEEGEDINE